MLAIRNDASSWATDARRQKDAFLRIGGHVIDVCGARPCYAGSWHGP
jgi:hypothetical protein